MKYRQKGLHRTLFEDRFRLWTEKGKSFTGIRHSFPRIEDRDFWERIPEDLGRELLKRGRNALSVFPEPIFLSDYREFSRTGNREHFEKKYFSRRRLLTELVLAECIENKGVFLDRILDLFYLLMEETTWCLPAHNNYVRDTIPLEIPDQEHPVIDLFAAETGAVLSLSEALLHGKLQEISPLISSFAEGRIRERILSPYLSFHFWWMGDGKQPMLNWTPWITQNVLLSLFAGPDDFLTDEQKSEVIKQACLSLDYFLDEYEEDGCCEEGAQYFGHAGLCLFGCMELLQRIAGESLAKLWQQPLIRSIAAYIHKVSVGKGYYLNYADCSALPGRRTARDFLFALYTGNEAMAGFAAQEYRESTWEEKILSGEENLYYHLLQIQTHGRMMDFPDHGPVQGDSWFESTEMLVARDAHYVLAVKGGWNADAHNHNDVGSVILYKDKKPFLIDLGVETYTKKTFSEERYEIWTMQSAYHNLPTFFDGNKEVCQAAGEEYRAADTEHEISDLASWVSMDIAAAYPDSRIRSYKRTAALIRGKKESYTDSDLPELYKKTEKYGQPLRPGVLIRDVCDASLRCVLSFMVSRKPVVTDKIRIELPGLGTMEFSGAGRITVERCEISDARLSAVWGQECYRILAAYEKELTVVIN